MTTTDESTDSPRDQVQHVLSTAQDRAQEALRSGGEYVRENPIPTVIGALVIGLALGALLCPRSRREPDPVQSAREWLEDAMEEISNRIPKAKKQAYNAQSCISDHVQDLGKKLKFW